MYWRTKGQQTFRAIATKYNYFVYPHGCGLESLPFPVFCTCPLDVDTTTKKMQGFDELKNDQLQQSTNLGVNNTTAQNL
jgi:hypothetical protein